MCVCVYNSSYNSLIRYLSSAARIIGKIITATGDVSKDSVSFRLRNKLCVSGDVCVCLCMYVCFIYLLHAPLMQVLLHALL